MNAATNNYSGTGMKAATITVQALIAMLLSASGCGGSPRPDRSLSREESRFLRDTGGIIARNIAYPEGHEQWREAPSDSVGDLVIALARRVPATWTILYRAASDTLTTLESPYQGEGFGDSLGQGLR